MMPPGKGTRLRMPELQCGQPEIGMAPLIDVVFLLIIFFVVTTVFPDQNGIRIEKPSSAQTAELPRTPLTLTLDAQDRVYFKGRALTIAELPEVLRQDLAMAEDAPSVVVQTDRRATAQGLIRVIDACKTAGIEHVAVATEEPKRVATP